MRKTYVFDTSVLAYDPRAYRSFTGQNLIIPICVLEELDKLKTFPNEVGKNARVFIRTLDEILQESSGSIAEGIWLDGEGEGKTWLHLDGQRNTIEEGQDAKYADNQILACAQRYLKLTSDVTVLSRDINLRVRAQIMGMKAENYETDNIQATDLYTGFREVRNEELGFALQKHEPIDYLGYEELDGLMPNECVHVLDEDGHGLAVARRVGNKLKSISKKVPWGLDLRNKEQAFAAELLLDPKISLVTLTGKSGTGKSLVAIAAGLEVVCTKKVYDKFLIYRPIQPMGNEIGFTPGSIEEKLDPWMQPIKDSFEFLMHGRSRKGASTWQEKMGQYADRIEMAALTYIRGRSIPNTLMLIDEAQQLTKEEVKAILTRASSGTKIVMTGDIEQIDNPRLDAVSNGLTYVIEKFKDSELAGHVSFCKGERSMLATRAAEIL